jgi:hypothetical protein
MARTVKVTLTAGGVDAALQVVGTGEGLVGEVVPLEVAPAALDRVQLRGA